MEKIKKQVERMQETVNNMDEYADIEKQYKDLQIEDNGKFMKEVYNLVNSFDELAQYIKLNKSDIKG